MTDGATAEHATRGLSATQTLLATLGLVGFAFVQPLLSILGDNPVLFTFNHVDGWALVVFSAAMVLVPTLVSWMPAVLVSRFDRRAGWWVHAATMVVLFGFAAVQWVTSAGLDNAWVRTLAAGLLTAGFGAAYLRLDAARSWVRYTSVLPLAAAMVPVQLADG